MAGGNAYTIFRNIVNSDDGNYASEIARDTGIVQSTVSDNISGMINIEIIEKAKRTQAQYYDIDWTGFYHLWLEQLLELESAVSNTELAFARADLDKESFDEDEHAVYGFFCDYCRDYMEHVEDSTINKMIIDHLYDGLAVRSEHGGLPDGLQPLYEFFDKALAGVSPSFASVEHAIIQNFEK